MKNLSQMWWRNESFDFGDELWIAQASRSSVLYWIILILLGKQSLLVNTPDGEFRFECDHTTNEMLLNEIQKVLTYDPNEDNIDLQEVICARNWLTTTSESVMFRVYYHPGAWDRLPHFDNFCFWS